MASSNITSLRGIDVGDKDENKNKKDTRKKHTKRKLQLKIAKSEQDNDVKRTRHNEDIKDDMMLVYQPWVIQTYGDLAKTKTITLKKYARILRTLRGEEISSADNSKFRFWVKAKGFCIGKPSGYEVKPADTIIGRYSVCDCDEGIPAVGELLKGSAKDPPLYVPNVSVKNANGDPVYRKVAVVENFFDIIYNVHVNLEGKPGKHAGQKRTYRTITETYAFLPREAVTRFLLGCTECQKRPRSTSPTSLLPTPSPSPTMYDSLPSQTTTPIQATPATKNDNQILYNPTENHKVSKNQLELREKQYHQTPGQYSDTNELSKPINRVNSRGGQVLISNDEQSNRKITEEVTTAWPSVKRIKGEQNRLDPKIFMSENIDYTMPITTTYLKYMQSIGCKEEDALNFDNKHENLPTPESSEENGEETYNGNKNGASEIADLSSLSGNEEMAGLWAHYHSALGIAKGKTTPPSICEQSSPINAETGSAHDETSSSGNKEDEDDDDDDSDDKIDAQTHDPERLKAFNMFVRLFVDENLDRMVPISKQPKEKIQAIIDSCTRQFPEFAERARKRIRTYLKSCRRNKRARDPNASWDASRPTPAHLTSVQAEQILASACENESHNAKRMRLGLEPVSQPMPVVTSIQSTDTTAPLLNRNIEFSNSTKLESDASLTFPPTTTVLTTSNSVTKGPVIPDVKPSLSTPAGLGGTPLNGIGTNATGTTPTAMYRPNFSQAFQRAGPYPLFPGPSFGATGLINSGPADLTIKQKPLVSHKLNTGEMAAVRQLITGYRESAAFLLRSADELEQLLLQQQ